MPLYFWSKGEGILKNTEGYSSYTKLQLKLPEKVLLEINWVGTITDMFPTDVRCVQL